MIHMSQVKVPVKELVKKAEPELFCKGKIGKAEEELVKKAAAKLIKMPIEEITFFGIEKKSMDARKKNNIQYIYRVSLSGSKEQKRVKQYGKNDVSYEKDSVIKNIPADERCKNGRQSNQTSDPKEQVFQNGNDTKKTVIAGFGPAGMFAALELARAGKQPVVLERGLEVEKRQDKVDAFWKGKGLDPECNVQFGEGGAGTFSDGKLNTLVKDSSGRNKQVLRTFVEFGAPEEILYLQKPHIGTDVLKKVVKNIREEVLSLGGTIYFGAKMEHIIIKDGKVQEVMATIDGQKKNFLCDALILAIGHSARDTFSMLKESGIKMEQKAFAVGVRIEHPQEMIGRSQYGEWYTKLPTAEYKVTHQTAQKRGVYSFCMCPGGYVVNASSEEGMLAVNGMSYSGRDSANANSAIVVTVDPSDFGSADVLAGVAFQRKLEKAAYEASNGKIPVQLFGDFLANRCSTGFGSFMPQMKGGYDFANVRAILPVVIGDAIAEGIQAFDRRIKGYGREDAILSGVESRTSSPVRMVRDEALESNIQGLYPCGEGAGYAGGITSAAMDGIRVAQMLLL